MGKNR